MTYINLQGRRESDVPGDEKLLDTASQKALRAGLDYLHGDFSLATQKTPPHRWEGGERRSSGPPRKGRSFPLGGRC